MYDQCRTFFAAAIIILAFLNSQSAMAENAQMDAEKNRHAVIDKISGGFATFLVGEDERVMVVDIESLENGGREGDWFLLHENGDLVADPAVTEKRRKEARGRLDMLRGK
jgi:hypothetical protein